MSKILTLCLLLVASAFSLRGQDASRLPVTSVDGHSYYIYKAQGDESLFGIARTFGWDDDVLSRENPQASSGVRKGMMVYYPVPDVAPSESDDASPQVAEPEDSFRFDRNPLIGLNEDDLIQYMIQDDDSLQGVASSYNTTVRDIFFLNPSIADDYFPAESIIRLLPNSKEADRRNVPVNKRVKTGERNYKIKKGDTFSSIAASAGVSVKELKALNPKLKAVKNGKTIRIPQYSTVTEWRDSLITDVREFTPQGRKEIYQEVCDELASLKPGRHDLEIVVVSSLNPDDRNRDKDFLRGFLMGVNTLRTAGTTVGVKVVPVKDTSDLASGLNSVRDLRPNLIVASFEKDFPEELARFGAENNIDIVNAFDAKSDLYKNNHSMIQLLIPSADMNKKIAEEVFRLSDGKTVVFIADDASDSDSFSAFLKNMLRKQNRMFIDYPSTASLRDFTLTAGEGYIIVPNLSRRSDIMTYLEYVGALIKEDPSLDVATIGRPTWVTIADSQENNLKDANTYIPSRFYINSSDSDYELFNRDFERFYNDEPVRSFPAYAPMGYDIARYFINALLSGRDDFAGFTSPVRNVELDFDLMRPDSLSGLVNENMFFIHYSPSGMVRKINF